MIELPFGLPTTLTVPGLGTLKGGGVVLVYLFVILLLISLLYFAFTSLYYRRRDKAESADSVFVRTASPRPSGSAVASGPPHQWITGGMPYQETMECIATHLASKGARHICIGEIEGGFLLLYSGNGIPAVETMTTEQITKERSANRKRGGAGLQQQLIQVGHFLDQQLAISVMVSQQQGGFYMEYAAVPNGQHAASTLARVSRHLDADALARLPKIK